MAGQRTATVGWLLAAAMVSVTLATVTQFLEHQTKFGNKFKNIDFIGKIMSKQDGARGGAIPTYKDPGQLDVAILKKDEMRSKTVDAGERAHLDVFLPDNGGLRLRSADGVIISEVFWKSVGIANGKPSDPERTEIGNAIVNSLNALVKREGGL